MPELMKFSDPETAPVVVFGVPTVAVPTVTVEVGVGVGVGVGLGWNNAFNQENRWKACGRVVEAARLTARAVVAVAAVEGVDTAGTFVTAATLVAAAGVLDPFRVCPSSKPRRSHAAMVHVSGESAGTAGDGPDGVALVGPPATVATVNCSGVLLLVAETGATSLAVGTDLLLAANRRWLLVAADAVT